MKEKLRKNVLLLVVALRALAGLTNTASVLLFGLTITVQTGNWTKLVTNLFHGSLEEELLIIGAILSFILGGFLSAFVFDKENFIPQKRHYIVYFYASLWTIIVGLFDFPIAVVILSLGTMLGLQNAMNVYYDGMRVRSTILSGATTDIGRDLGLIVKGEKRKSKRLKFNLLNVFGFLIGVTIGSIIFFYTKLDIVLVVGIAQMVLAGMFFVLYNNLEKARKSGKVKNIDDVYK